LRPERGALAALAAAVILAGCGGSGDDETTTTTTRSVPPPRETIDHVPKLPASWHKYVNERGGFALGLPRGWEASSNGPTALVRSFDRLVAISIAPDRRAEALDDPLDEVADLTAEALTGFRGELELKPVRDCEHRYECAEVRARGTAKGGVKQRLQVIVLRRDGVAQLTAVIAANAKKSADESLHLAKRVVATLRTRPPESRERKK
jgi:hypothetical protein